MRVTRVQDRAAVHEADQAAGAEVSSVPSAEVSRVPSTVLYTECCALDCALYLGVNWINFVQIIRIRGTSSACGEVLRYMRRGRERGRERGGKVAQNYCQMPGETQFDNTLRVAFFI